MSHRAYAQSAARYVQYEGLQKAARLHLLQCCAAAAAAAAAEFPRLLKAAKCCLCLPQLPLSLLLLLKAVGRRDFAAESPTQVPLSLLLSSRLASAAAAAAAAAAAEADHSWGLGWASGLCYIRFL